MIAHIALRKWQASQIRYVHAYGWSLGGAVGSGIATSRAEAVRLACLEALDAGAGRLALPMRDWSAARALERPDPDVMPAREPKPLKLQTHSDDAAVAVAMLAAARAILRQAVRERGPVLPVDTHTLVNSIGGPHTVAAILGVDPAQVCWWYGSGMPEHRRDALQREIEAALR